MGGRGEQALLSMLVTSGAVLLGHPLPLLLEVAHDVLPDLHEVDGLGEAVVGQAGCSSGFLFPLPTVGSTCLLPLASCFLCIPCTLFLPSLPPPPGVWTPDNPGISHLRLFQTVLLRICPDRRDCEDDEEAK